MKINLDLIKPSPRPVRSSWGEDKMQELTQSIKEQGLIVPIKVRPDPELEVCVFHGYGTLIDDDYEWEDSANIGACSECRPLLEQVWVGDDPDYWTSPPTGIIPFEIVYGHRRVEACRRAGLGEVEAIVEGVEDLAAIIQAGIENVHREDMPVNDKAEWIRAIKEQTNWSNEKCAKRLGIHSGVISKWLSFLSEYEAGAVPLLEQQRGPRDQSVERTLEIKRTFEKAGIDSPGLKRKVAEQTADLSRKQVREVADTVARAKDDAEREAILETDYADLVRMPQFVEAKAQAKRKAERRETKKRQEEPREVKQYIDTLRSFQAAVIEAAAVAEYGKFSPEAARFVLRKHDDLRQSLAQLEEKLRKEQ